MTHIMTQNPSRIVPGALHPQNRGACDWGWQSLLAYGCQNSVVIVDPKSVQVLQVLRAHKSNVVKVKWAHENYRHDLGSPYKLRLATGDATGHVFTWDASKGAATVEFSDGSKPILDMNWLSTQGASLDLLVVLHAPSLMILWNADTGAQLWKKSFQENLICFAFDPFNSCNVTLMSQEYILFVSDFSVHKAPAGNGRKFFMTSTANNNSGSNTPLSSTSSSSLRSIANSKSALKKVKLWAGDSKNRNDEENVPLSDCLELAYLPSCRHHVLLLFPRELLILDMEINQAVSSFILERNSPSFLSVIPTKQRDALMCLHESGMIAVRIRRRISQNPYVTPQGGYDSDSVSVPEIFYDSKCQSDPLRLSKSSRLFGFCCSPVNERNLALIVSDGRIMIWNLKPVNGSRGFEDLAVAAECPASLPLVPPSTIDTIPPVCLRLADMIPSPSAHSFQTSFPLSFKFVMTGLLNSVTAPPTCVSKCPPLTTRNWNTYKPLVAVGSTTGAIQVFNMKTGNLTKEYAVHTCPIKGISWIDLHSFLSWGHTTGNIVRNELQMLDLRTGHSTQLNLEKSAEDTPIESVKISSLKQYFLVIFKDRPMELWDLRSLTVIRRMPSTFLAVTAVEWTPLAMVKQRKRLSHHKAKETATSVLDSPAHTDSTAPQHFVKEEFVLAEVEGLIRELSVEGSGIKEHIKFPHDGNMGTINNILWKNSHMMVFSDANGTFSVLEMKSHLFVTRSTQRGTIKKMKFGPGKENSLVFFLFSDGFDIWDLHEMEKITSFKVSRDDAQVVDVDWLYSDMLVVAFSNGVLLATHTSLKDAPTAMTELEWEDPVWCPHLMSSKTAFITKSILQHQFWREKYNFNIDSNELPDCKDKMETNKQPQESEKEQEHEKQSEILHQLSLLPQSVKDFLISAPFGTAQRSLIAAQLFGDESEVLFWTVVLHFLRREKARLACPQHKTSHLPQETSDSDLFNPAETFNPMRRTGSTPSLDLLSIDDDLDSFLQDTPQEPLEPCTCFPISLDTCYDVLCDTETFQKYQLDRLALHDSKRSTYNHTRKCAETLVLLGQADRAVQMYLETDPENENHYTDSLRACLVATIRSSGASQSTIKLVATNLIASGKLAEGVQLLCLINKGLDACRYLQTYGEWDQAAWLAKATLNYTDGAEVMRRWIEHLSSSDVNQQSYAVMVLLSLGQFHKALDMLYSLRHFNRAMLFAEACQEFGFLSCDDEKTADLIPCVYVEYARYMFSLDMKKAAEFYIQKAGFKGKGHFEDPGIHL